MPLTPQDIFHGDHEPVRRTLNRLEPVAEIEVSGSRINRIDNDQASADLIGPTRQPDDRLGQKITPKAPTLLTAVKRKTSKQEGTDLTRLPSALLARQIPYTHQVGSDRIIGNHHSIPTMPYIGPREIPAITIPSGLVQPVVESSPTRFKA